MKKKQTFIRVVLLSCVLFIVLIIGFGSLIPEYLNRWGWIHLTVISAEGTYPSDDKKYELHIAVGGVVHYSVTDWAGKVLIKHPAGAAEMRWIFVWGKDDVLWLYDDEGISIIKEDASGKWNQSSTSGKDTSDMPSAFKSQLPSSYGY